MFLGHSTRSELKTKMILNMKKKHKNEKNIIKAKPTLG